jgi:hypothetical protein
MLTDCKQQHHCQLNLPVNASLQHCNFTVVNTPWCGYGEHRQWQKTQLLVLLNQLRL